MTAAFFVGSGRVLGFDDWLRVAILPVPLLYEISSDKSSRSSVVLKIDLQPSTPPHP